MRLSFALWYLRNGHMIAHPLDTKHNPVYRVFFINESHTQLLFFEVPLSVLKDKMRSLGEEGYIQYLTRRNLVYVTKHFPIEINSWLIPYQFMRHSGYEKFQRQLANEDFAKWKSYQNGVKPTQLYLDEMISLVGYEKHTLNIDRAVINDLNDDEYISLRYYSSRNFNGIRPYVEKIGKDPTHGTSHGITIRDLIFSWKFHQE